MQATLNARWADHLRRYDLDPRNPHVGAQEIASWLSDDVRYIDFVDEWISTFQGIAERRKSGGYLASGNAHRVYGFFGGVLLESEYVDEMKVFLTIDQIISALRQFRDFLRLDLADRETEAHPLTVSFTMEGDQAISAYERAGGLRN